MAITEVGILQIINNCTDLQSLNCSDSDDINFENFQNITDGTSLVTNGTSLQFLSIKRCRITDNGIIQLTRKFTNLLSLNCEGNGDCRIPVPGITNLGITEVTRVCRSLTHLDITNCHKITDIMAITNNCPSLISLDITNCYKITNIMAIANNCPSLKIIRGPHRINSGQHQHHLWLHETTNE